MPSEGAGALILKTRSAALQDGNTILARIKSTDVQHSGRSQGLIAPNVHAQIAMQRSLLEKANLKPGDIEYVLYLHSLSLAHSNFSFVEAHGTGTLLSIRSSSLLILFADRNCARGPHRD